MEHGDRFEDGEDLLQGDGEDLLEGYGEDLPGGDGECLWQGRGGERHNGLAAHN